MRCTICARAPREPGGLAAMRTEARATQEVRSVLFAQQGIGRHPRISGDDSSPRPRPVISEQHRSAPQPSL
jgi:hypothetical protein